MDYMTGWFDYIDELTTFTVTAYTVSYVYKGETKSVTFRNYDTVKHYMDILASFKNIGLYSNVTVKKIKARSSFFGMGDPVPIKPKID